MHEMPFIYNFPFFSILLTLIGGMSMPIFRNGRVAQKINMGIIIAVGVMNFILFCNLVATGEHFTYMMGHFPAPWGNEIRGGPFEALMATIFAFVMGFSILGGVFNIYEDVPKKKQYLYFLMMNLLLSSMIALIYTNDMFTAYVFIEINTLAACAIVMSKDSGDTIVATIRYLIMSLLGSGLFLMGIAMLYNITGHLLMESLQPVILQMAESEQYYLPLTVVFAVTTLGLCVKSALYPFHSWLPNAHGSATSSSSAILSGLVLKGYIILLMKMMYRVYTPELLAKLHITDAIFVLGILGMILGSVNALRERHIKRMTAYSSVAQIGYIFMGIGLNSEVGMMAASFHILSHAITKPMLFLAAGGLANVSGHSYEFKDLKGAAHRNKIAGVAFVIGALSMIGIPLFAGFPSKLFFSTAAIHSDYFRLPIVLIALAISTALNALYYLPVCINIWRTKEEAHGHGHGHDEHYGHGAHEESHEHGGAAHVAASIHESHVHGAGARSISAGVRTAALHGGTEAAVHGDADSVSEGHDALDAHSSHGKTGITPAFVFSMVIFIAANFGFGIFYGPIMEAIKTGLELL